MVQTIYYVMFGAYRQTFTADNIQTEDEARNLARIMARRYGVAFYGDNKGLHIEVNSEDVED